MSKSGALALQRAGWLFGCVLAILLISWADGETGEDIGLSVFYFAPVVLAAWNSGRVGAIIVAVSCAVAWVFCEMQWWHEHTALGTALNASFRLIGFAIVGLSVCQLRVDRDAKNKLNSKLEELLRNEERDARTDALTGLANRRSFLETLRTEIARDQRDQRSLCLLYLDLDNFKKVNDKFGHAKGDEILREVGSLMRRILRAADISARLGGDEFAALLWNTGLEEAKYIAERLVDALARLGANYEGTGLGASVGVLLFNSPTALPEDLLHDVDQVMYQAKREGKSRVILAERGKRPTGPVSG